MLILCLNRFRDLPDDTHFITGTGQRKKSIKLLSIYEALGADTANPLPGFHAFSGADNTGSFSGKGNFYARKRFKKVLTKSKRHLQTLAVI